MSPFHYVPSADAAAVIRQRRAIFIMRKRHAADAADITYFQYFPAPHYATFSFITLNTLFEPISSFMRHGFFFMRYCASAVPKRHISCRTSCRRRHCHYAERHEPYHISPPCLFSICFTPHICRHAIRDIISTARERWRHLFIIGDRARHASMMPAWRHHATSFSIAEFCFIIAAVSPRHRFVSPAVTGLRREPRKQIKCLNISPHLSLISIIRR